jgi:threonine dehydrogenase-like Zn-dependent dehydrogenase
VTVLAGASLSVRPSRASTMRAAVVRAPGVAEVVEVPVPKPKAGQVRVRLGGCGVCASNVPPWEGREWFQYPMPPGQLGHEAWGVIDDVGEGVAGFSAGQRVALLSNNAYAEYDVAASDQVVALRPPLDGRPFPAEPLGCAMNIFARSDVRPGQTVAIVGVGFLGAILARLASNANARVIAVSRRPYSLDVAKRQGAADVIPMDDHGRIIEQVRAMTGGQFCDVVVEAVGKEWPLNLSAELTRERGRLVVAGYHQDAARTVDMQTWNWRGLDIVNAHERDPAVCVDGMRTGVELAARGVLDVASLVTHTFPLARIGDALDAALERPDGFLKAVVVP